LGDTSLNQTLPRTQVAMLAASYQKPQIEYVIYIDFQNSSTCYKGFRSADLTQNWQLR
jgi:hypothetical protein